jgi:hypothetical protein
VVKNKDEWLESRKKLKERKKRGAKDGRTGTDRPSSASRWGDSKNRSSGSWTRLAARREGSRTSADKAKAAPDARKEERRGQRYESGAVCEKVGKE